jgi:uncharacterized protein (DUF2235 family)
MKNKRLIVCMDGTWQNMATADRMTNVGRIALSIAPIAPDGVQQLVHYSPGIGGEAFLGETENRLLKGAVGEGAEEAIVSAYLFLALNYQPGDEIYLFGFSRGAFCVRSLGGFIRACGLIRREKADQVARGFALYRLDDTNDPRIKTDRETFRKANGILANPGAKLEGDKERPPIAYIGVFDTVVMRGLPSGNKASTTSRKYGFHNLRLGDHVRSARHALAIDERRNSLRPTPWTNLDWLNSNYNADPLHPDAPFQQTWFTGAHGDVGGGQSNELSEVTRKWVKRGAVLAGLHFEGEALDIIPDVASNYEFYKGEIEVLKGLLNILGLRDREAFPEIEEPSLEKPKNFADDMARTAARLMGQRRASPTPQQIEKLVHVSAYLRAMQEKRRPAYNPRTLAPFLKALPKDEARRVLFQKLCDQMRFSDQILRVDRLRGDSERIS